MGWFANKEDAVAELKKINESIALVEVQLKALQKEKEENVNLKLLEKERDRLKTEINDLKIDKSKIEEKYAREKRETEHAIGLIKLQNDEQAKHAKKEAELAVREQNLEHEKQMFEEQMSFRDQQFNRQLDSLNELTKKILEHLPNVNYDISEDRTRATSKRPLLEQSNSEAEEGITEKARPARRRTTTRKST